MASVLPSIETLLAGRPVRERLHRAVEPNPAADCRGGVIAVFGAYGHAFVNLHVPVLAAVFPNAIYWAIEEADADSEQSRERIAQASSCGVHFEAQFKPAQFQKLLKAGSVSERLLAADIATPTSTHFRLLRDLLSFSSARVFVEKPIVLPTQIEDLDTHLARHRDRVFAADFVMGSPAMHYLIAEKGILESIGEVRGFFGQFVENTSVEFLTNELRTLRPGYMNEQNGGAVMDMGVHQFATVQACLRLSSVKLEDFVIEQLLLSNLLKGISDSPLGEQVETLGWIDAENSCGVRFISEVGFRPDVRDYVFAVLVQGSNGCVLVNTGTPAVDPFILSLPETGQPEYHHFSGFDKSKEGYDYLLSDFAHMASNAPDRMILNSETYSEAAVGAVKYAKKVYEHNQGRPLAGQIYREGRGKVDAHGSDLTPPIPLELPRDLEGLL